MVPSGSRPPGGHGERRAIGLFSLGFGILLFVLILARGQQAAKEGNQELRNDTYWVLVSPLVFSGFGVYLLRNPGKGGRPGAAGIAPRRPCPGWSASWRAAISEAARPSRPWFQRRLKRSGS